MGQGRNVPRLIVIASLFSFRQLGHCVGLDIISIPTSGPHCQLYISLTLLFHLLLALLQRHPPRSSLQVSIPNHSIIVDNEESRQSSPVMATIKEMR